MVWSFISTGIYLLKGDMFVKQFIHVQKKIAKEVINIIYFNTINKIPVFFRIIQYKLSFIEIWLTSFIDIGSGWKSVWKKWLYDEKLGRWSGIVDVKFPQIASFFIWFEKIWSGQYSTTMLIIFWTFWCFTSFFFHHKSNEAWLLAINWCVRVASLVAKQSNT